MTTKQVSLPAIESDTTPISPEEEESLKAAVNEYQRGKTISWVHPE